MGKRKVQPAPEPKQKKSRRWLWIGIGVFVLAVMAAGGGGDRNRATPTPGIFSTNTRVVTSVPTIGAAPTTTSTDTATAAPTDTDVPTSVPTNTDVPTQPSVETAPTTYYVISEARLRNCASTTCEIVTTLYSGSPVIVTASVDGEAVSAGNAVWYRTTHNGREAYVYSSIVTLTSPFAGGGNTSSGGNSTSGGSNTSSGGNTSVGRPGNCATAVAAGMTAQEAGQWSHLDRDGDGVACYGD